MAGSQGTDQLGELEEFQRPRQGRRTGSELGPLGGGLRGGERRLLKPFGTRRAGHVRQVHPSGDWYSCPDQGTWIWFLRERYG
jgi:hypothetical protein